MHACCDAFARTHVQDGRTALLLAYHKRYEAAAAELMEATKRAGGLDRQVGLEAWVLKKNVLREGMRARSGSGREHGTAGRERGMGSRAEETGREGHGEGRRALKCACACLSTG